MKTNRLISREEAKALDLDARIALESEVTDLLETNARRPEVPANWKFTDYSHKTPWRRHVFDFLGPLEGKTILDLGCGYNPTPVYFALAGAAQVAATDVSQKSIEYVNRMAKEFGVADRVTAHLAPAEDMPFDDNTFDLVHGEAVLHHLDLDVAGKELARIMKPGARAGFKDPLGQNPILELARDYIPYRWKHAAKGTDCPLTYREIERLRPYFSDIDYRGFGLFSLGATWLFGRRESLPKRLAHGVDAVALRGIPFLQRYCRFVVTTLEK